MMRRVFLGSTFLFWLVTGGFWAAGTWLPEGRDTQAVAAEKSYSVAEVAAHGTREDCWMAIGGQVYDFTAYLPQHPADPLHLPSLVRQGGHRGLQDQDQGTPALALCGSIAIEISHRDAARRALRAGEPNCPSAQSEDRV